MAGHSRTPRHERPQTINLPASRRTLTTGEVAVVCEVSPRTATQWVDKGLLRGHRLPMSRDRRVYTDDLVAFMVGHGLRVPPDLCPSVAVAYGLRPGEVVGPAFVPVAAFELASVVQTCPIVAAVIGDADGLDWAERAGRLVRDRHPQARVALVLSEDRGAYEPDAGLWAAVYRRPCDVAAAGAELAGLTNGRGA